MNNTYISRIGKYIFEIPTGFRIGLEEPDGDVSIVNVDAPQDQRYGFRSKVYIEYMADMTPIEVYVQKARAITILGFEPLGEEQIVDGVVSIFFRETSRFPALGYTGVTDGIRYGFCSVKRWRPTPIPNSLSSNGAISIFCQIALDSRTARDLSETTAKMDEFVKAWESLREVP